MIADLGLVAAAAYPLPPNYSRLPLRKPSASSLYEPAAMASVSPSSQPSQPGFGGGGPSSSDGAAPSNVNLDVLKTLTEKRTTRGAWKALCGRYSALSRLTAEPQTANHRSEGVRSPIASQP